MSFVHLHTHTVYSLLDGFSNVKQLVKRAKEMDMPALAITDHGTMFGAIEFYNAATDAGIKPIIGMETYMAARGMADRDARLDKKSSHLLLLAENAIGYQNLLKIASAAQLDGFYYYPRVDHDFLAQHAEGLICTSGCMSAEIPRALLKEDPQEAVRRMDWYYEVFGPDRFFVELQSHNISELVDLNKQLLGLGARYSSKFVATNDVHYVDVEDARYQDVLLAIQTGTKLADENRMRMTDNSYYLRSPKEMNDLFAEVPEAISNSLLIAERCNVSLESKGYHLPEFPVPEGHTTKSYLRVQCEEGLIRRYGAQANSPKIRERLDYELQVIDQMGFNAYFLIVWDLCVHARQNGIWYNARGSAAGSIIGYVLDITLVDPIAHGLIFERFLNPGRVSMPDIDLDFRDDRRNEMLEYTAKKYGDDKVAQIITFGTMAARGALRDVARVMDIPISEVERISKLLPNVPSKNLTLLAAVAEFPDLKRVYDSEPQIKELIDTAAHMEGVVRNAGTHAAGVVISDRPLVEYLPLHRPTSGSEETPIKTVTQFEMGILDSLGMLKVDFLGLSTLTVMARACDMIKARHGKVFDLNNIPVDDAETYELLGRGQTAGVFQVEGSGMTRYLMDMKPHSLDHIIAMVALYRPGPLEFIPSYIRRMHGEEIVEYRHPSLEPIMGDTFGIPIYQEQIMRAVVELADFTPSESDDLRKAISKKHADKVALSKAKFIKGAQKIMSAQVAEEIFTDWEGYARYGFNKSHAADYGVIAVQTAYLKTHYTAEYMTALMSVFRQDTAKIASYIVEARSMGIEVQPPDVNYSEFDFSIENDSAGNTAIRFGLGAIKNVGQGPVDIICAARAEGGIFKDISDFANRVDLRSAGKRSLESLIKVGALDNFGPRGSLLAALEQLMAASASHFRAVNSGQLSLFGGVTGVQAQSIQLPTEATIDRKEMLNWERELIGLYLSDHPLSPYMDMLTKTISHNASTLSEATHEERVRVAGMVSAVRPFKTKKGSMMGFVTIEDLQGNIELVIFPRTWEKNRALCEEGKVIIVVGKADTASLPPKVLVDEIHTDFTIYRSADVAPLKTQPTVGIKSPPPSVLVSPKAPNDSYVANPDEESDDWDDEGAPPPPESPPEWDNYSILPEAHNTPLKIAEDAPVQKLESAKLAKKSEAPRIALVEEQALPAVAFPPIAPPRFLSQRVANGEPPRVITIMLRPNGDPERDKRRIKHLHGILTSYPGSDRFSLQIFESGKGYLLDFPSDTTRICPEMLTRIQKLLGQESWRIEPLTFQ